MPFLSYAQNNEDVLLWRAFRGLPPGFYVDVGAADPDADSVTRAFYDRGWHGIDIEAVPGMAARIAAARPRDTVLALAAGAMDGAIALHVCEGTGLSTTDPDEAAALDRAGYRTERVQVPMRRLAAILDEHAPDEIHFLKIDVEGAERAVLEGCDFSRHRPRIVLVEATRPTTPEPSHHGWEPLLLAAAYRFAYFDGLNRFYVADEWHAALAHAFATPVNVFDEVIRIAEMTFAGRTEAELTLAAARASAAEDSARAAYGRAFEQARDLGTAREHVQRVEAMRAEAEAAHQRVARDLDATNALHAAATARAAGLEARMTQAERLLLATRNSTSWRVTAPLRTVSAFARFRQPDPPQPIAAAPAASPEMPPPAAQPEPVILEPAPRPRPLRTVHQFHSGSATGDAVTNSMFIIRAQLRRLGYHSHIFVEHRDPALARELRLLADLPAHDGYVLIVHHSMGHDRLPDILALPAPKILYYHNITPAALLPPGMIRTYADRGRQQLQDLRGSVRAAVAASAYNAIELHRAGFDPVAAATLLFDLDALDARAAARPWRNPARPFTVLFVGRVIESKGQADLVEAFARFRTRLGRPACLVLVGRTDSPGEYLQAIDASMRRNALEAELVLTGGVSDEELAAQYAAADLYVSLSHHEGFGVPLVEAIAYGIPVLAWPCGAIPYTLETGLLDSRDAAPVADAMLRIARDPAHRAALVASQRAAIGRFALGHQWPAMQHAICLAGAAPPPGRDAIAPHLHYAIAGHAAGSYSLAAINRTLARAIDAERPGHARLVPIDTVPITDLSALPADARALVLRPPPPTGPEITISQHYPIHVPERRGDLTLALTFWEESLLPWSMVETLNAGFDGVLAPSAFVAKALTDSGVRLPVHVVGNAPDLSAFEDLARRRRPRAPGAVFTFLHVSSCFPRKGVDILLAAFARTFRASDPVRLVIKGFPNPHNTVPQDAAALRAADPDAPAIEVIDGDLDPAAMLALYAAADAMVLPTRGEGLNLPAAEAMTAGLPLIVTASGGHMDFCDAHTARLLAFRLAPSASHLASGHSLWAEPDADDLAAALTEMEAARRDAPAAEALALRTARARAQVAARLGRRAMVRRIDAAATHLLLRPPARPLSVAWVSSWGVRCGVAEYVRHLIDAMPPDPAIIRHVVLPDHRHAEDAAAIPPTRTAWRLGDPNSLDLFEHAVTAEDPDILVIQHQPGLMPWEGLAAWLTSPVMAGRTSVVTLHNTRHLLELTEAARATVLDALAAAGRVMVHAIADLDRLNAMGLSGNVTLLPHGVAAGSPPRPARTVGDDPVIGCYGFFLPHKGIGELIQALALLRRTRPRARLRLVNADYGVPISATEIAQARAMAQDAGVQDAIEWHTEFLPDARSLELLAGCDVIALPTQSSLEASSAAVRQALAAGAPVLVTPLAIFDNAGDAVRRSGGTSPEHLAAALDGLLGDVSARSSLQRHAAAWVQAHGWDQVARRLQGMIIGLAASHGFVNDGS